MRSTVAPSSRWTFSAADRVAACPASAALPQSRRAASADAARGTAIHALLRDLVVEGADAALARVPADAGHRAACEHLVSSGIEELWRGANAVAEASYAYAPATGTARYIGRDLERGYAVEAHEVAGTLDLVAHWPGEVPTIIDWKTGRYAPRAEGNGQLLLGALCVSRVLAVDNVCTAIVTIDPETGHWQADWHVLEHEDLERGAARVWAMHRATKKARELVEAGVAPDVTMGSHCRYCAAIASCPGQAGALRMLLGGAAAPLAEVAESDAGRAWVLAAEARRALDMVDEALRMRVDASVDGQMALPDGSVVRRLEVLRESIDVERALAVAREHLGDEGAERARGIIKASIGKAELLALAGRSTADKDAFLTALRAAGATRATSTTSYRASTPKGPKKTP